MKKLPIGIQSFSDLRNKDFLYVDKTEAVLRLIVSGKFYFLSRPRRFGKSLLLSTIEEVFKGNKSLFENLFIYDKWDWTQKYPVIKIDWSNVKHSTTEEIEQSMPLFLKRIADAYKITLTSKYASDCFLELIEQLHQKSGEQVVVLIDEYDMPILDALNKSPEIVDDIRRFLQSFYKILKGSDEHLRFVFLTGVSKFAKMSIFSGLNNLKDISMNAAYSTICGYTQEELESYFDEHIVRLTDSYKLDRSVILENIRKWYNGYSWDGNVFVYNPLSVLLLFDENKFSNYWFATGTPTFLTNLIRERDDTRTVLEPITVDETAFWGSDIQRISLISLLFQTGYLTVKSITIDPNELTQKYTVALPNKEVKDSFLTFLVSAYANHPVDETQAIRDQMKQQIQECDSEGFSQNLQILLANIPYFVHVKSERYYHSLFLVWLRMLGFDVQGEVLTNIGRIDAVWQQSNLTVIVEIKYHAATNIDSLLNDAMNQINNKKYYEKYADKKIILLAVAFSGREVKCKMETIEKK